MNNILHIKTILGVLLLLIVLGTVSFLTIENPFRTPVTVTVPQSPPDLTGVIQKVGEGSMVVMDPIRAGPTLFPQRGVYAVIWTPDTKFFKLIPHSLAPGESIADAQSSPNRGEVTNALSLQAGQSIWVYKESIVRMRKNNSGLPEVYASVIVINP